VEALLADLLDDETEIEGLSYEHLFRLCRERFLVSSDATLRSHLTEFKDHNLIKTRKGQDGVDLMTVPLPIIEMSGLLQQLESDEVQ
jgi:origin recognition complex subunit 2